MRAAALAAVVGAAALAGGASPADPACTALAADATPGVTVTAATPTPAPWSPPGGRSGEVRRPFCRVEGTIGTTIGFELWLPAKADWTGRFLGAGVGGSAGTFNYADLARGVDAGFAAVTTDTGHRLGDKGWILDPRAAENFTHRGVHLATVAGKQIAERYYGSAPKRSYFIGCSGGGRQGLKEMQRYPEDYDGIIAGAPGPNNPLLSARHLSTALLQQAHPEAALTADDWRLVEAAVTRRCDRLDGARDGLVAAPDQCPFELDELRCRPGQADACLSPAKVDLAKAIYAPLRDEHGRIVDEGLLPGQQVRPGPAPDLILEMFGQVVHHDPDWDPRGFRLSRDVAEAHRRLPDMRADSTDVAAFKARGGKLILYHGWWDSSVLPQTTLAWRRALAARHDDIDDFSRLFLAPGVYHCRGGPGPDSFGGFMTRPVAEGPEHDLLALLVRWVEDGVAPSHLVASKVEAGRIVASHRLCPYPARARYLGGDPKDARSFTCDGP